MSSRMNGAAIDRLERVMTAGFETLADLQRETNQRLDRHEVLLFGLKGEVTELKGEVTELKGEVTELSQRFDNFLLGVHRAQHEEIRGRVGRIERHLKLD